uniref:Uncharacterized protein n=1 Tax=Myotis myotis TaxID=51298 RepID=A0A7J7YFG1_MYOMY|nr:hypothetical protein mMyoMyo1_011186 [Myotis myotis]
MQLSLVPGNVFIRCFYWMFPGRIVKQKHPFISSSLTIRLHANTSSAPRLSAIEITEVIPIWFFLGTKLMALTATHKTIPTEQLRLSSNTPTYWLPLSQIPKLSIAHDEGSPYSSKILFCCCSLP